MNTKDLHSGHRERTVQKFLKYPDSFADHELLELLLFYAIPRTDTNHIAHGLLNTFGNVETVMSAEAKELQAVDGIGEKTAAFITLLGKILKRIEENKAGRSKPNRSSFAKNKQDAIEFFDGLKTEKMFISLLDEKYNEITKLVYGQNDRQSVSVLIPDIAKAFAINKPRNVIIAHNHPSGAYAPSQEDDVTTAKLNMLCAIHGIKLCDHYVVAEGKIYSYFLNGRLDYIKINYNINDLLESLKEIDEKLNGKE